MKYSVGIDLGTTHCALACIEQSAPADSSGDRVAVKPLLQLVDRARVDRRELLPSFLYFAAESEAALPLPWDENRRYAVGAYARARAAEAPGRVVSSAKSWFSHAGFDPRAKVLPSGAPGDLERVSPLDAARRYLEHIAEAYEHDASSRLVEHDVTLTVPASFDPAARDLTVEAARLAGLENLTLLEEPQAAFYGLVAAQGDAWRELVNPGDMLLVIDVGGGTSDFSAIALDEEGGKLVPHRIAVGDHILLGGDNMDLAIAHLVRRKLEARGKSLDAWQMSALLHESRRAKEELLREGGVERTSVVVPGRGSQLFNATLTSELLGAEVQELVVDGFFPRVGSEQHPQTRARAALTQQGLSYAADPAVTKHLAAFLGKHARAAAEFGGKADAPLLAPTCVLLNGGVFKSAVLAERVLATLNGWLAAAGLPNARLLPAESLDVAVARGAAYYGRARKTGGLRIRGGIARSYYVGIETPVPAVPGVEPPVDALCVAPFGMEEGSEVTTLGAELGLIVGEAVRFRFFSASDRRIDSAGKLLEDATRHGLEELAPIEVTLKADRRSPGSVVPVTLRSRVTELGTLSLSVVPVAPQDPAEHWQIELNVRR